MTSRRRFLLAGALSALSLPYSVAQTRPVKIGMLSVRPVGESLYASGIVRRLGELGYHQGAGTVLEIRSGGSVSDSAGRELIDLKCDLIFVVGSEVMARSLRDARASVPIVIVAADYDPVAKGLVESLNRPGGNITGIYLQTLALVAKRLELLREVVSDASRFLMFADPFSQDQVAPVKKAAESMGLSLSIAHFSKRPYDFETAFETGRAAGVRGLVIPASPVLAAEIRALATLATKHRLPAIGFVGSADAGFLLSYSVDNHKVAARAAEMGVRILNGAKPADIPIEQPDAFELVVNLKTAKALSIKIPYSVMARATKVIE